MKKAKASTCLFLSLKGQRGPWARHWICSARSTSTVAPGKSKKIQSHVRPKELLNLMCVIIKAHLPPLVAGKLLGLLREVNSDWDWALFIEPSCPESMHLTASLET